MLQICAECTTAYSVGARACPHCGSTDWVDQGAGPAGTVSEDATEPQEN
jgi:RNA polymerase subunit RPABC4/transcription elongation factor Spt4